MRDLKKWGVSLAAQCGELRAAGGCFVFSAGPAGCFYKRGNPLHNAHRHRCLQPFALTMQGHVVSAPCVTSQHVRYAESGPVSGKR